MESGSALPASIEAKRPTLEKWCVKLAQDDASHGTHSIAASGSAVKKLLWTAFGLGGGYMMWTNRRSIVSTARRLYKAPVEREVNEDLLQRMREARLARLQRKEEIDLEGKRT